MLFPGVAMSQKTASAVALVGALVAGGFCSALVINANQPHPPAAAGPTFAGFDWHQILNGLGGVGGIATAIIGFLKANAGTINPTLGKVINNPEIGQFIPQIPAFITLLTGGTGTSVDIDVNEKIGNTGMVLSGKLKLSREAPK